jgi:hypothetical protein
LLFGGSAGGRGGRGGLAAPGGGTAGPHPPPGGAPAARGEKARAAAQSDYLSPLGEPDARRLIAALQGLIGRPGG